MKRHVGRPTGTFTGKHPRKGKLWINPNYNRWNGMILRCHNKKTKNYHHYGGREISVCDRWRVFENFKADMGEPPDRRMQLDRKNGKLGYSKSNCRWATRIQNNKNRTNLRMVSFEGITMCVADWEKYLNLPTDKLRKKLRFNRPLSTVMAECGYQTTKLPFNIVNA